MPIRASLSFHVMGNRPPGGVLAIGNEPYFDIVRGRDSMLHCEQRVDESAKSSG